MADSRFLRDNADPNRQEAERREMNLLVREIYDNVNRDDYKKHNILLIGQSGSGKSSIINNVLKPIIGRYIERANSGGGNTQSNTLQLKWYPNCCTVRADFEKRIEMVNDEADEDDLPLTDLNLLTKKFKSMRDKLPDLYDAAGMKNKNDAHTRQILRLLIGGFVPPDINISALEEMQNNEGMDYLDTYYDTPRDENKISMVIFACSCLAPVPHRLIKCVREVIGEFDPTTHKKKYDCDVFLLITKYDRVERDTHAAADDSYEEADEEEESIEVLPTSNSVTESSEEDVVRTSITMKEYKSVEAALLKAFAIEGAFQSHGKHWTNYNDAVGYDDQEIDKTSLQLLKKMTDPINVHPKSPDSLFPGYRKIRADIKIKLRKIRGEISSVHIVMFGCILVAFFAVMWALSQTPAK